MHFYINIWRMIFAIWCGCVWNVIWLQYNLSSEEHVHTLDNWKLSQAATVAKSAVKVSEKESALCNGLHDCKYKELRNLTEKVSVQTNRLVQTLRYKINSKDYSGPHIPCTITSLWFTNPPETTSCLLFATHLILWMGLEHGSFWGSSNQCWSSLWTLFWFDFYSRQL